MKNQRPNTQTPLSYLPVIDVPECATGTVQSVDLLGREIAVELSTGPEVIYVPPDCPVYLRGERIKLRMLQPRDQARVTFGRIRGMLVAERLEVQPGGSAAYLPSRDECA